MLKRMLQKLATVGVLVASCMLPMFTYADTQNIKPIFSQLAAVPTVRAQFEQQKKLASLNKVFSSEGTVLFHQNHGVLWQIRQPVQADLIVTQKKLVQKTQRTQSQIEVDKTPYGSVATMFLQLMSGNEAALAKNFNVVSARYSPTQWNLVLTPKSALFKNLFVRVEAQGQRYVDRIVIYEKANNTTTIRFTQQRAQPQSLTAAESALFQLAK